MADLVSPGVQVKEKDLTASVRSEPTSIGATTIVADWGPMNEVITVGDETELVDIFGKPSGVNYEYWFTAANFLAYSNTLRVVRLEHTGAKNAVVSGTAVCIPNTIAYQVGNGVAGQGPFSGGQANVGEFAARYAGGKGNSIKSELDNIWAQFHLHSSRDKCWERISSRFYFFGGYILVGWLVGGSIF